MIMDTNNICAYYGLFILFEASTLLIKVYSNFILAIKATIIVNNNLDYFEHIINIFHFYKSDYSMIIKKKITKFRFANCLNILLY